MAVGAGNNLVECLECHSLYHQECHNPPVTQDVNDPRFVWYCASCSKTMNKVVSFLQIVFIKVLSFIKCAILSTFVLILENTKVFFIAWEKFPIAEAEVWKVRNRVWELFIIRVRY